MNSIRFRVTQLGLIAIVASLAACGGGGGGSSTPASPPVAAPAPTGPTVIAANLVTVVPAFTGSDSDRIAAYTKLNAIRGACGFGLLAQNTQLETSGQNHVNYMGSNYAAHNDALSHQEVASYLGFTGVNPQDRNALAGYGNSTQGEDFATGATSSTSQLDAVNDFLTAAYHMRSIVGSNAYDMGIATAVLTPGVNVSIVELGAKTTPLQDISSVDVSTYPCAGLSIKTSAFGVGREVPDPLPGRDYNKQPVGQPIYVRVRVGQTLAITSFTVVSANGTSVTANPLMTVANDPNGFLQANEAIFFPSAPLAIGTSYTVTINGTNNGVAFTRTFAFNTI